MALLIHSSGEFEPIIPKNGSTFTDDELRTLVDGYLGCIAFPDGRLMWIDEEGLLQGKPINMTATNLVFDFLQRDVLIVGRAVMTTRAETDEETQPLSHPPGSPDATLDDE